MVQEKVVEGSTMQAPCPKCNTVTEHIVVKGARKSIWDVSCKSCGHGHKTRAPGAKKATSARRKKQQDDATAAALAEWESAMQERDTETPRDYVMKASFSTGTVVVHPTFGKGVVARILSDKKLEIIFRDGRRKLVQNAGG